MVLSRNGMIGAIGLLSASAFAADVNVIGLAVGKAVVVVNGGKLRVLDIGNATPEGVKLISATPASAVLEVDGKREIATLGQTRAYRPAAASPAGAVLAGDSQGHFVTTGAINGIAVKLLVDTGATMVSMSDREARRVGVNYLNGERGVSMTASGPAAVYRVKLDQVRGSAVSLFTTWTAWCTKAAGSIWCCWE